MRLALLASPSLRRGPLSPLQRFARDFERFLAEATIYTTEGCYRALMRTGVLHGHPKLLTVAPGYRGGLVQIAVNVVLGAGSEELDAVIYLIDPRDNSSNFPETNALKRECVVNKKPFLATSRSAREWVAQQWHKSGGFLLDPHEDLPRTLWKSFKDQTIALVAHDDKKKEMLQFGITHASLLAAFGGRIGTGTTATLLSGERPGDWRKTDKRWREVAPLCRAMRLRLAKLQPRLAGKFVEALKSGPKGGDVQIANRILSDRCHVIVFFEDPDVARQHETDIQLLERTGRVRGKDVICIHDEKTAHAFAKKWQERLASRMPEPLHIATALARKYGVKCALVPPGNRPPGLVWEAIVRAAAWIVRSEICKHAALKKERGTYARLTVAWGVSIREIRGAMSGIPSELSLLDVKIAKTRKNRRMKPLEQPLAETSYMYPENVVAAPMLGIMGADDESVESNEAARDMAQEFRGKSIRLALSAILKGGKDKERARRQQFHRVYEHWQTTDILVSSCAPLRAESPGNVSAAFVRVYYDEMRDLRACGDMGGIYLRADGEEVKPAGFERIGMSQEDVRSVRRRGGSILIAGADEERLPIVRAALAADMISILVTDLAFARQLLSDEPRSSVP